MSPKSNDVDSKKSIDSEAQKKMMAKRAALFERSGKKMDREDYLAEIPDDLEGEYNP
jgi:hypothetical protein